MDTFLNTSIVGAFIYICAGSYDPMKKIGIALLMIGMIGTTITYQRLKERIEKIERQINKESNTIRRSAVNE